MGAFSYSLIFNARWAFACERHLKLFPKDSFSFSPTKNPIFQTNPMTRERKPNNSLWSSPNVPVSTEQSDGFHISGKINTNPSLVLQLCDIFCTFHTSKAIHKTSAEERKQNGESEMVYGPLTLSLQMEYGSAFYGFESGPSKRSNCHALSCALDKQERGQHNCNLF